MATLDVRVGQVILLGNGAQATVRYVGETAFKAGIWVGVELATRTGKNNGTVGGIKYFSVPDDCGLFLGLSGVKRILSEPPPQPTTSARDPDAYTRVSLLPPTEETRRMELAAAAAAGTNNTLAAPTGTNRRVSNMRGPDMSGTSSSTISGARTRASSLARKAEISSGRGSSRNSVASVTSSGAASGVGNNSGSNANPFNPDGRLPSDTAVRRPKLGGAGSGAGAGGTGGGGVAGPTDRRSSFRPPPSIITKPGTSGGRMGMGMAVGGGRSPVKRPGLGISSAIGGGSGSYAAGPSTPSTPSDPNMGNMSLPPPLPAPPVSAQMPDHGPTSGTASAASNAQLQELQAKLRILEKRRVEDRDKLSTVDALREERERYKSAVTRLQAKMAKQQPILAQLRQQLAEAEAEAAVRADLEADFESQLEMTTLDREVAEEQADLYRAQLTECRMRLEEVQLELEISGAEKKELEGELSPDEKRTRGWVQMERENDRLREALLRLRDLSRAEVSDLEERLKGMEAELADHDRLRAAAEDAHARAEQAESISVELRQQLDAAEEAADMVEQLSNRNMALAEHVGRLQAAVQELETLRELSEEVEQCQAGNERQLLEMLDEREGAAVDLARRVLERDELLADQAFAIDRLRAAVDRVQAEAVAEREATQEKAAHTHAREVAELTELSTQLHRSATGALGRQIDVTIQRLETEESKLVWKMVGPLVPAELSDVVGAVEAVLLARRVGGKAGAVAQVLREGLVGVRVGVKGGGGGAGPSNGVAVGVAIEKAAEVARLAGQLMVVAGLCGRLVGWVDRIGPDTFISVGRRLAELGPVERTVEWIASMVHAHGELDVNAAVDAAGRSVAVVEHVAECMCGGDAATILSPPSTEPDDVEGEGRAQAQAEAEREDDFQYASDHAARLVAAFDSSIALVRLCGPVEGFPFDSLLSALASARIPASHASRSLTDLHTRGLVPPPKLCRGLVELGRMAEPKLSEPIRVLTAAVLGLIHDPARSEPVTGSEVSNVIPSFPSHVANILSATGTITATLSTCLPVDVGSAAEMGGVAAPPPWECCAARLEQSAASARATAEHLRTTTTDLSAARVKLTLVHTELQDTLHERDVLTNRLQQATAKAAVVPTLENDLSERIKGEARAKTDLLERDRELAVTRRELAELTVRLDGLGGAGNGMAGGGGLGVGGVGGASAIQRDSNGGAVCVGCGGGTGGVCGGADDGDSTVSALRIRGLQAAVRYLVSTNQQPAHQHQPEPVQAKVNPWDRDITTTTTTPAHTWLLNEHDGMTSPRDRGRGRAQQDQRRKEAARAALAQVATLPERVQYVRLTRPAASIIPKLDSAAATTPTTTPTTAPTTATAPTRVRIRNPRLSWQPARTTAHYQLFEQQLLSVRVWSLGPGRLMSGGGRMVGDDAGMKGGAPDKTTTSDVRVRITSPDLAGRSNSFGSVGTAADGFVVL